MCNRLVEKGCQITRAHRTYRLLCWSAFEGPSPALETRPTFPGARPQGVRPFIVVAPGRPYCNKCVCVCACERCLPFHVVADIEGRPIFMSHHDPAESFPLSWLRKNFDADRSLKECFCGESRHRHGWPHCGVSDSSAYDLKS